MAESTPKAIDDCHDLLLWIIPQLDKFPRNRRFTLGERIESGLLDVLEALTAAAYGQDKRIWLDQANRRINSVRHLWRLAHELRVIPRPANTNTAAGASSRWGRKSAAGVNTAGRRDETPRLGLGQRHRL